VEKRDTKLTVPAIILSAGRGKRLLDKGKFKHKSLIEIDGRALLILSIEKLFMSGFTEVIVVIGDEAESVATAVRDSFGDQVRIIENKEFASFGNMASLMKGIELVETGCVVLDADIIYEIRALELLNGLISRNGFITTKPSGSGDEVFVKSLQNNVVEIAKSPTKFHRQEMSEYIGLLSLSSDLVTYLKTKNYQDFGLIDYETIINSSLLTEFEFLECYGPNLVWAEVDSDLDLKKLMNWPKDRTSKVIEK
jgi:choline kinase